MVSGYQGALNLGSDRHKVFISYYHRDDQRYKEAMERHFGHLFIAKSVASGDIDTDISTEYIKRLIQEGYLDDASVLIVLVGPNTYGRKHVDWEIAAALNKKIGGYSGLIGILLPEFSLSSEQKYRYEDIPARLADNVKAEYATVYTWAWLCADHQRVKDAIQTAFTSRLAKSDLIDNSRLQMQRNTSGY
jgi:hypothetical protein